MRTHQTYHSRFLCISVLGLVLFLTGCFWRSPSPEAETAPGPETEAETKTATVPIQGDTAAQKSNIEIIWEIPAEPVEGFIIRYGGKRDGLDQELMIPSERAERIEDPQHGQVYRYVMRDLPIDQTVYLTIAAYKDKQTSPPSQVYEITPDRSSGAAGQAL